MTGGALCKIGWAGRGRRSAEKRHRAGEGGFRAHKAVRGSCSSGFNLVLFYIPRSIFFYPQAYAQLKMALWR
jgi:hypothetical protein